MSQLNRYISKLLSVLAILGVVLSYGCTDIDSEDLRTSGFHSTIRLSATGNDQTTVRVYLNTSSALFADEIDLSAGDQLTATANGVTQTLSSSDPYRTTFNFDDSDTDFVVSLDRQEDVDAPNSYVTLPEKFTIDTPSKYQIFNSGESITLNWTPPINSGLVVITYDGNCILSSSGLNRNFYASFTINDTGTHTVLVNDVLNVYGNLSAFETNTGCITKVEIVRSNTGVLDPNYGRGGVITATQTREVDLILSP